MRQMDNRKAILKKPPSMKVEHVPDSSEENSNSKNIKGGETGTCSTKVNSMFTVRTANQRVEDAKSMPVPRKLFGSFIYESGLTIFFGNTHAGKTAVAMNIAQSIASGVPFKGIEMDAEAQKVVYFDFELSDKNFELKSSEEYKNHFKYSDNLSVVTPDLAKMEGKITAEIIMDSITAVVEQQDAKVLFIDNISWLEQNGLETSKEANKLMKDLWVLSRPKVDKDKISGGYAVIVLAHTTKKDNCEPMTISSLAGSAAVSRYLESCLAINWSVLGKQYRYIKQLKNRWGEEEYGKDNVLPIVLGKDSILTFHKATKAELEVEKGTEENSKFLTIELSQESSHLSEVMTVTDREEFVKKNVVEGDMSIREAAAKTGYSHTTIKRDKDKIEHHEYENI